MGLRIETGTFEPGEGTRTTTRLMLEDPGYDITSVEVHPIKHLPGKEPGDEERRYLMVTVIGATKGHIVKLISSGNCNVKEEDGCLQVAVPLVGPEEHQYHVISSEPQSRIEYLVWKKLKEIFNEGRPEAEEE